MRLSRGSQYMYFEDSIRDSSERLLKSYKAICRGGTWSRVSGSPIRRGASLIIRFLMSTHNRSCLIALALVLIAGLAHSQNSPVMLEALKPDSPLLENLRKLTDKVGGRVPGT